MSDAPTRIPGAESWSSPGVGPNAEVGVAVVHGFLSSPVTTRPLGEAIAAHGYAVEVPCLPGHGTVWQDLAITRYMDWRGAVERVLVDLRARCRAVVLVGHSFGGALVLDVAADRGDEVAGVVVINPFVLDRTELVARVAPLIVRFLRSVPAKSAGVTPNDAVRPGVDAHEYARVPAKAGDSLRRELPRVREQLAKVAQPILVVRSREDHVVPTANGLAVLERVGSGDVSDLLLENSYHLAPLDNDHELLEKAVADFVARVTASP